MPKTSYLVTAPNGQTFSRTTASRAYTHTVIAKLSHAHALENAKSTGWARTDRSNFNYYQGIIKNGGQGFYRHSAMTDEQYAARCVAEKAHAEEATRGLALGQADEFVAILREERIARVAEHLAEGYYDIYHNLGWCGRLDLAQKLANKNSSGYYHEPVILEALEVRK